MSLRLLLSTVWWLLPLLALASVNGEDSSITETPPRLWEVDGKGVNGQDIHFYVLGVTHSGLDAEYDPYFFKRVVPIFKQADVLSYENAVLNATQIPGCAEPLARTSENVEMLASARKKVALLYADWLGRHEVGGSKLDSEILKTISSKYAEGLSEYGLIVSLSTLQNSMIDRNNSDKSKKSDRVPVSNYLVSQKNGIEVASIDEPTDIVEAYCSQAKNRPQMFKLAFDGSSTPTEANNSLLAADKEFERNKSKFDDDFVATLRNGSPSGSLRNTNFETEKGYVCGRNKKWLSQMLRLPVGRIYFYALGIAHLYPSTAGNDDCPGLLKLLQESGLRVMPVR